LRRRASGGILSGIPMGISDILTAKVAAAPGDKPRDDELDLFGLTHIGKVRKENQDHFLLATIHRQIAVHATSLPAPDSMPLRGQRQGTIMLVADGVGSGAGADASRLAVETITSYVASSMRSMHATGRSTEDEVQAALYAAALESHAAVRAAAAERRDVRSMATTLTLVYVVWPWAYVLQVGDSRFYYFKDGVLRQVTRDQTVAQDLVDQGALPPERVSLSPFAHVLASSIGGPEALPIVTRLHIGTRGSVLMACSDGLTKHLTDQQIAEELSRLESCEQLCRRLVDMALAAGGSDNVTVIAGRALPLPNGA
jgi:serine/threonine protein phosphatase PrpC